MNETVHLDCNFYNDTTERKKQCTALIERICNNKKCNFYLTKKEYREKMLRFSR
jgi:hypothetical protein